MKSKVRKIYVFTDFFFRLHSTDQNVDLTTNAHVCDNGNFCFHFGWWISDLLHCLLQVSSRKNNFWLIFYWFFLCRRNVPNQVEPVNVRVEQADNENPGDNNPGDNANGPGKNRANPNVTSTPWNLDDGGVSRIKCENLVIS